MKTKARKRIGLALGGGVVRGMAHLGVLTVLQRLGVSYAAVAGTSVGALVGAFVAAGRDLDELADVAGQLNWRRMSRPVWPRQGLVEFDRLENWLMMLLDDIDMEELPIPFAAVATDMETGEEVILDTGRLAPAVRASCSVPGIVVPRRHQGRLLADGCVVNNLPVSAARRLGAEFVIAVDIFEPNYRRRLGPLGFGITFIEALVDNAGGGVNEADCLIQPPLAGMTYMRFSERDALFESGVRAAEAVLPALENALAQL